MPVITHDKLKKFTKDIFLATNSPEKEAELVAELLVRANLCGVDSHGVIRIPDYVKEIEEGKLKPGIQPKIVKESKVTALIDGQFGFGQVTAMKAMELAIEKAQQYGTSTLTVFNCNHIGRLADYPTLAVEKDMIGLIFCKGFPVVVAPWGGRARLLGTNPLSFGIPAGKEKPIIADFATSVSAEGKIRVKFARGEKIPLGWIVNSEGKVTDEPAELYKGGAILPFGGYKGYAINLLIEALGGALGTGGIADEFKGHNGLFIQVVNIDFFTPIEEFKEKIDRMIRKVKSSPLAEGFKEILLPGEPELIEMEKRLKDGIMVEEKTWSRIVEVANRYRVELPKVN